MSFSPNLGRWLQQDPIGYVAGSMNLYQMEGNSPINQTDPSGTQLIATLVKNLIKAFNKLVQGQLSPALKARQKELNAKLKSIDEIINSLGRICPKENLVGFARAMLEKAQDAKKAVEAELKVIESALTAIYPPPGRIVDVEKANEALESLKKIQKETDDALKKYDTQRQAYDKELDRLQKRYRFIACVCQLEWVRKTFPGYEKPLPP